MKSKIITILILILVLCLSVSAESDKDLMQDIKINQISKAAGSSATSISVIDTKLNNIADTLADIYDTQLAKKLNISDSFSRSYNDLTDTPFIPDTEPYLLKSDSIIVTKISELQNDSGFITNIDTSSYLTTNDSPYLYNMIADSISSSPDGVGDTGLPALTVESYDTYPNSRKLKIGYGLLIDTSTAGIFSLQVDQNILKSSGNEYNIYTYSNTESILANDTYIITISDTEFGGFEYAGASAFVEYGDSWYINSWQIGISGYAQDTMSFVITVFDNFDTGQIKIKIYDGIYNSQLIFNDTVIVPYDTYIFKVDNLNNSLIKQFVYIDSIVYAVDTGYVCDNSNISIELDYNNNKIICVSNINDTINTNELMLQVVSLSPGQSISIQQNTTTMTYGSKLSTTQGIEYAESYLLPSAGVFSDTNVYNYTKDIGNVEAALKQGRFGYQIDYNWANNNVAGKNIKIKKFKY